jgi:hypothetical protein
MHELYEDYQGKLKAALSGEEEAAERTTKRTTKPTKRRRGAKATPRRRR